MVMVPEVRGAGKEWSWPVFIRPSFIPVGMLCLTDVIDHEGRHIFGAAWPDITKPISTPSEISPKTILGGLGSVGMGQYKPTPRLDPIHNQIIKEAVRWTRQLLDSLNDAAIIIDENTGDKYKLNQSLWASQDGTTVLTSGRIPPGLGIPIGWVYVREDMLKAVWEVKAEADGAKVTKPAISGPLSEAWPALAPDADGQEAGEGKRTLTKLPLAKYDELRRWLKEQKHPSNEDALLGARQHFGTAIQRNLVRNIRKEEGLLGARGRPGRCDKNSAKN